jgi:hypothetical protein
MDNLINVEMNNDELENFFFKFLKDKIKDVEFIKKNNIDRNEVKKINDFLEKDPDFIKVIIKEVIVIVKEENIHIDLTDIPNLIVIVKEIITMNVE